MIDGRTEVDILESKKDLMSSLAGVMGVAGPLLSIEEESLPTLLRKLRSMVEKSESIEDMSEPAEDPDTLRMSGAVKACTLVVEMSSVGNDMRLRLMVPGGYLTVFPRTTGVWSSLRLLRLVKARARDIVEVDMASKQAGASRNCYEVPQETLLQLEMFMMRNQNSDAGCRTLITRWPVRRDGLCSRMSGGGGVEMVRARIEGFVVAMSVVCGTQSTQKG